MLRHLGLVMPSIRMHLLRPRPSARNLLHLISVISCVTFCVPFWSALAEDLQRSGTVTIEQVQIAFIGSGNLGGGKLKFGGQTYDFTIGGLGIGGIGVSKIRATGTVYNLKDPSYFPGAYAQARYGAVAGSTSTGELWLKNSQGVVMELRAEREGLALSLGGDAVYIKFD